MLLQGALQQQQASLFRADQPRALVIVSRDSGSRRAVEFANHLRQALPSGMVCQVPDAHGCWSLTPLLQLLALEPRCTRTGEPPRVLVAGGDGTVSWAVDQVWNAAAGTQLPVFGVLPYGTGNDLARALGWLRPPHSGSSASTPAEAVALLRVIEQAPAAPVDRWQLRVSSLHTAPRIMRWSNYLSIGFDAGVALAFDAARRSSPSMFTTKAGNKAAYGFLGARDLATGSCHGLARSISVQCDGRAVILPAGTRGLLLLNISSFMGGVTPWRADRDSRHGDGLLEVVAHRGALHLAAMQLGLDGGIPLGRATHVIISTTADFPVQADGEPWMQAAASVLEVTHAGVTRFAVSA